MSDRLEKLYRVEVSQQVPAEDGTKRMAYHPTPMGKALRAAIEAMKNWGLHWQKGTQVLLRTKQQYGHALRDPLKKISAKPAILS
jgi:DNA-binding HxlR family transcriptional regulator